MTSECVYDPTVFYETSSSAKDIIKKKDPAKCLGVHGNIRGHCLFQHIHWVSVEVFKMDPPYIPEESILTELLLGPDPFTIGSLNVLLCWSLGTQLDHTVPVYCKQNLSLRIGVCGFLQNPGIGTKKWNYTTVEEFILLGLTSFPNIQIILFVIFLPCYITSLAGNIAIILISKLSSRLHTPMYFFLSHLSFLDICHTSIIVPVMLIHLLSERKTLSFNGCVSQMFIHLSLGGTECYLLLAMAYDRYVAICCPLHYTNIMHPILCNKMAAGSWVGGILNSIVHTVLALQLPFCGPNVLNHFFCEVPSVLELACADTSLNKTVIFFFAIFVVMGPFFLILITYGYIISSILKISTSVGRRKAFSTCASHITVVSLFYGTIIFMYMRPGSTHVANQDKMAALFYSVIAPMLNPLIYTLRNKDVIGAFKDIRLKRIQSNKCSRH
ncbi:putative olfactory receptor 2B8 [Leptodactylus fuscus]|uniref:olfactory receptor 2B8-like n=1 Tax=Leptodactylus fuscus TaxID=238119 RepID=UPI003F4ED366